MDNDDKAVALIALGMLVFECLYFAYHLSDFIF